tara:strand:+ start:48 stop:2066 length:2019 start_codon:yes stop_codon:yes gene_type:complete
MGLAIDLPIFYSAVCILLAFGYAYFLYHKESLITSLSLKAGLFLIRFLFISILSALLLNPIFKTIKNEEEKPILVIAQDVSSSIKDSVYHDLINLSKKFPDFDVYPYSFSNSINSGFSEFNNGLKTNYNKLVGEIESRFSNRNIAGLIIATDGLYNNGPNPLYTKLINYPIYPISLGDTTVKKDVKILKVKHNQVVFLGNTFPLEIALSMQELQAESVDLSVWHNSKKIYTKSVEVISDDDYNKIKILVDASDIGLQRYQIVVSEIDGEDNIKNNYYTTYVDVIDSKYNILLLHSISHPDVSAYKGAIDQNKNYTTKTLDINEFNGDIDPYQLIVLFGLEKNVDLINNLTESRIPLLLFELNKIGLKEELSTAIRFNAKGGLEEVSAVKNEQFSKFTFSDSLSDFISEAPPLITLFGSYNLLNSIEVILKQKIGLHVTSKPIISMSQQDGRKTCYVTAEGFWRWKLYDYSKNKNNNSFNEFFNKLTQYLILHEDKSRFRIEYKKQITEDENIYFNALLFNEIFELITDKDIYISIANNDGDKYNFEFSKVNNSYVLDVGKLAIGQYSFLVEVKGTSLTRSGSFEVKPIQLEQLNTVADHKILFALAEESGGAVFNKDNMNLLIKEINKNKNNYKLIHSKEKLEGVINIPWILLILLFLISLEWFLRKYNGLL